ncbi:MAG: alpha-galactosidase [Verrucomicrobia bacterium]|nr:alpha-galactosidase [Verrucomicrobiota bacterium]
MKTSRTLGLGLLPALLFLAPTPPTCAVTPAPAEFEQAQAWFDATFSAAPPAARSSLKIVHQDTADGVSRGRSWRGTPFQIGDQTYSHGLAFNSTKHLEVRLARPGRRFTAEVGLENNDDTRRGATLGNGSVTFHVLVDGTEVFSTPVLRLADGPRPLSVPLNGALAFELRVKDGGDGRGWDQALWAVATVELEDGTRLRLQDLPWADAAEANPFGLSFQLGQTPSTNLLPTWTRSLRASADAAGLLRREVTYADPATGLQVRLETVAFGDFPAIEWVAHFRNQGTADTPLLENLLALDTALPLPPSPATTLHWAKGGVASFDDFAPQLTVLKPGTNLRLQPGGGRSSSQVLPFFNVEGPGGGIVTAIGWTGEWAADFSADAQGTVSLKTGLAKTRLVLKPGEEVRTPRMLLLFYQGDRWRGQNLLRRFLLAHHRPTVHGRPMTPPITCGNWGGTRAEVHLDNIRRIVEERLPVDYYWIDAEWYGTGGWPTSVGDWRVKTALYPEGFKPLSDALRQHDRELMLWFEPERVHRGTPWHRDHADWLLTTGGDNALFNLGLPAAREFLTRFIGDRVEEFGLGCYRQDFNIDPLGFWQKTDAPDRQGMAEIRYIEGLYAFWDGLRARHPGLLIDNCASGGRRIDLETVGRSTPFWRTDGPRDPIAHQCHTYGLLAWVPLSATSQDRPGDDYEFRSSMCSSLCLNWWVSGDVAAERVPAGFPFDWARRTLAQYVEIRDFYLGDYYPLTPYSQARDVWMAYQLDRPEAGDGLVVVLRRPDSPYESARLPLRQLRPDATYAVRDLDAGTTTPVAGRELIERGLEVRISARPGSALLTYRQN